jgi:hypothetical protein
MDGLSSVDKGDAVEAAVIAELKRRGKVVLTPFGDNQRYDLVIDEGGEFTRVQVKTAREVEDGKVIFNTAGNHTNTQGTTKKPYYKSEVDVFIAYNPERDIMYRVPIEEAPNKSMTIRHKAKQEQPTINWAEDYEY